MTVIDPWRPTDRVERRLSRSRLHAYVRRTSSRAGAGDCMIAPTEGVVRIRVSGETGRGHVSGLKRCRSPWACPYCAPKIRQRRAAELTELVHRARSMGHVALLVTYTLPHKAGEPLADVFGHLSDAWRRMWSGRWAEAFKADTGMTGAVRAYEVTFGDNGWHPHVHQVIFLDCAERDADAASVDLWLRLFQRWVGSVEAVCGRRPSALHGIDVEVVHDPDIVGDYVAGAGSWSIGSELTAGPVKITRAGTSVTPFEILGSAAVWGCSDAAQLWAEYENATTGRHAIQASRGLYDLYGVTEASEDEAAAPEAANVVAEVVVDLGDWVLLVEYHATDRFVMAVEEWAATGSGGPPTARMLLLEVLGERRRMLSRP